VPTGTVSAARTTVAGDLLGEFADRTGLTSDRPRARYLWTDAFAVCTFLGLGEVGLARRLVDQVHEVLGRHRPDDGRRGWLSGLPDDEAAEHPTRAGLRIGKPLPERPRDRAPDERLDWDRDGQYFHYLTQWMHALDRLAGRTGEARYNRWARELAAAAHEAFVDEDARGRRRMHWKMSIDLGHPAVAAMGHHDPLDGLLTCLELSATAEDRGWNDGPDLGNAAADFASLIPADLETADPLGIGGLLRDAWRADELRRAGRLPDEGLPERLARDAVAGLATFVAGGELGLPASARLAFRELGLAIGLAALGRIDERRSGELRVRAVARFDRIRSDIETTWLLPDHRATATYLDHRDINDVMLATALVPDGYLGSPAP
jgi:hypothetical protein